MDQESEVDPAWAQLAEFRRATAEVRQGWTAFLRERLLRWALRWTIGFAGIYLVTVFYPDFAWLWWAGAGLALLSLSLLLGGQLLILRKLARSESAGDNLEATLKDLEAAGPRDDGSAT